jgi:predicted membrane protein
MRDFDKRFEERRERWQQRSERNHRHGHIWTGVLLLLIGAVALLKSYIVPMPVWLFTWQMLLIVLGLFIGFRHRFQGGAWFVLILVGGAFLANDYFIQGDLRKHIWPVILIAVGILFIFRSRKKSWQSWSEKKNAGETGQGNFSSLNDESYSQDDFIDATSIFGGTKKNILSKNFKGGDIVNVFGGTELNLTQADITGVVELELTTIFGGTKLIVPSNWSVKSEAVTIFGGIEDKRSLPQITDNPGKVLVLKGTVIFGGIDIKSF